MNNARSAYACFLFLKSFFLSYNDGQVSCRDEAGVMGEVNDVIKCKISSKVRYVCNEKVVGSVIPKL